MHNKYYTRTRKSIKILKSYSFYKHKLVDKKQFTEACICNMIMHKQRTIWIREGLVTKEALFSLLVLLQKHRDQRHLTISGIQEPSYWMVPSELYQIYADKYCH